MLLQHWATVPRVGDMKTETPLLFGQQKVPETRHSKRLLVPWSEGQIHSSLLP